MHSHRQQLSRNAMGAPLWPLLLALPGLCCALATPNKSLATLPIAYLGGTTAPRTPENLAMLSKLRVVVIDKTEGPCWAQCITNTSKGLPCNAQCHAEKDMLATIRAGKSQHMNSMHPGRTLSAGPPVYMFVLFCFIQPSWVMGSK